MEFESGSLMMTTTWLSLRDVDDIPIGMLGRDNVIVVLNYENLHRLLKITCLTSDGVVGVVYLWNYQLLNSLNVETR